MGENNHQPAITHRSATWVSTSKIRTAPDRKDTASQCDCGWKTSVCMGVASTLRLFCRCMCM